MKHMIIIILILLSLSCKAQTIIPIESYSIGDPDENVYYKDVNNLLDKFIGTWVYSDGNTEFTLITEKSLKVELDEDDKYYTDEITGWFMYKENGVIIVNTLNMLWDRDIIAGSNLSDDTKIIHLFFNDPQRPKMGVDLYLRYIDNTGGQPQVTWKLYLTGMSPQLPGDPPLQSDFRVPKTMTLTKE